MWNFIQYLCIAYILLSSLATGVFVGYYGWERIYCFLINPVILLIIFILNVSCAPIILVLQRKFNFIANQEHIAITALILLFGIILGSGIECIAKYNPETKFSESRFVKIVFKIAVTLISAFWSAIIGAKYTEISLNIVLNSKVTIGLSLVGILIGWYISNVLDKKLLRKKCVNGCKLLFISVGIIGFLHLVFLLCMSQGSFILLGVSVGFLGAPAILTTFITGIESK